jgi:penicillin-binding protein 1A
MTDFQTKRIPVVRSQRRSLPKPPGASAGRIMGMLFLFVTGGLALGLGLTYFVFLSDLPAISKLEDDILPESSIIYDRNGNELYNMYSTEKRRYAKYSAIDQDMVHAIVAAEDKTFFENSGIDFKGLVRSVLSYFSGKTDRISGTSTISQQLIRNVFLTTERSLDRKVKEMYLSFQMTNHYSKEKILEIYLNKISFGSNASGVDQAARTFFGKSVADISPLEASILASIPKGPTYYSPYTQRLRLMGGLSAVSQTDSSSEIKIDTPEQFARFKPFVDAFRSFVTNLRIEPVDSDSVKICGADQRFLAEDYGLNDGCVTIGYTDLMAFLGNIRVPYDALVSQSVDPELADFALHYTTGRKDFVLGRMFQDGYIDPAQYAASVVDAVAYQFVPYREDIKYPHFVFYVQEYLEREYGLDFLDQGGLKIYTTLDPKLQDKAQELVTTQAAKNATAYSAKDAGLVSIDNANGQILVMVGGTDYFGE